ncbi:MAG TPA: hypothetical protein VGQ12_09850 [Candidatus Angelobacter sp.]|nr:hypothetical protein [Candidatus Angelobacter sp.]
MLRRNIAGAVTTKTGLGEWSFADSQSSFHESSIAMAIEIEDEYSPAEKELHSI